jgi:hypothetical protein
VRAEDGATEAGKLGDRPLLQLVTARWRAYTSRSPDRNSAAYLWEKNAWRFASDGTVELTSRRGLSQGREMNSGPGYVCTGRYRTTKLLSFVQALKRSGVCARDHWEVDWGVLWLRVKYALKYEPQGGVGCATRFEGHPVALPPKLASVVRAWSALEQSICGECTDAWAIGPGELSDLPPYRLPMPDPGL